jgi:hypothetical protein
MTLKVINTIFSGVIGTFKVTREGELAGPGELVKTSAVLRRSRDLF